MIRLVTILALSLSFSGCLSLSFPQTEAAVFSATGLPREFAWGAVTSVNPILPSPEAYQAKQLATALALKQGLQISEATPGSEAAVVLDFQYNEVSYNRDLSTLRSITGSLTLREAKSGKKLLIVFSTRDTTSTLASWATFKDLVQELVSRLAEEIKKTPPVVQG